MSKSRFNTFKTSSEARQRQHVADMPQMLELFDAIVAILRRAALARPETDNLKSKSWFMTNRSVAASGVGFGTGPSGR